MRACIQRVSMAKVELPDQNNRVSGQIEKGFLVLLGVGQEDEVEDAQYLARKIFGLRVFEDEAGKMNLNLEQVGGRALVVSQFTLYASYKKGNRPSWIRASKGPIAEPMYEKFCQALEKETGKKTEKGIFGADMKVSLLNDGPVTIIMDTKNKE